MFFPTKSARIGSSLWPRSTSVAKPILIGLACNKMASNDALTVLPVYKTSSMIMTTFPVMSTSISKALSNDCFET